MGRPAQSLLSRPAIAAAALEVIDEGGVEALTMRRIAGRLGVRAQSLYNHVRSKDDILDAITELLDSAVDVVSAAGEGWRARLLAFGRGYRRSFKQHPDAAAVIARRPVETTVARNTYDTMLRVLIDAGWSPRDALQIVLAIDYLVLGSVISPFSAGFSSDPSVYERGQPSLAAAVRAVDAATVDDTAFEHALTGFVTSLGEPRPHSTA